MLIVFCFWPGSIFGGPHVHQLRPDCGEIYDCNEIAFIVCVGVGDVTNLACGCSSWLNRVVYYPWVAWLFQYLAAGFSKTRDFITKLSGTADYYYLRAPPLCSVPGGWRRRKPLEWRNVIALVMIVLPWKRPSFLPQGWSDKNKWGYSCTLQLLRRLVWFYILRHNGTPIAWGFQDCDRIVAGFWILLLFSEMDEWMYWVFLSTLLYLFFTCYHPSSLHYGSMQLELQYKYKWSP